MRPLLPPEDGLELRDIEQSPRAVDEPLVDRIQGGAAPEQQIAAVLELVAGIAVAELRARLLVEVQGEAQATRVDPTVTDLGQSPYRVLLTQGLCELIQGLERSPHEAVALLLDGDGVRVGLAVDPFVPVEHELHPERWVPADLDRDVAPLLVDQVKVVVVDVGPGLLAGQVRRPGLALRHLPHQGRRLRDQDEKEALKRRVLGQILLRHLVLARARDAVDHRDVVCVGVGVQPPAETSRQALQMLLVQRRVGASQAPPPGAEAPTLLAERNVAVQDDPVDAVVVPVEQILMIGGEIVGFVHGGRFYQSRDVSFTAGLRRRPSFPQRSLGKSVAAYRAAVPLPPLAPRPDTPPASTQTAFSVNTVHTVASQTATSVSNPTNQRNSRL
jgi:hypothetical protein